MKQRKLHPKESAVEVGFFFAYIRSVYGLMINWKNNLPSYNGHTYS
ncbi:hypothetical protein THF1C08_30026 [Vibrio jasicida]|uniref:Transposase n=1 Tax=Vibrio jasicida TaxID=766224 RepID=A0AAU9QU27_9VIBR|nr:hypothetical protein THF1C08_30026 [Vibrio jasicida]CAH1600079.1 hypothetical protein THF1A12_40408 [Vibrio jasicida]